MIDWSIADRVAGAVAGRPSAVDLTGNLTALAARSTALVVRYTGMRPTRPLPAPESVSREAWIDANLKTLRSTLDPLADAVGAGLGPLAGPARAATGVVLGAEIGVLTGYLSQRVLGQYELSLLDPDPAPRLLFVAPNIRDAAGHLGAQEEDVLAWIAFHEITHAVQFGAVDWLRPHVAALLRELLAGMEIRVRPGLRFPTLDDVRGLLDTVREGGLVAIMTGPERMAVIERLQAVMAMIEGHAEHVMDAVGVREIPSLERLRAQLDRRRRERAPLTRLLEWLLGLELKLRQYEVGRRFCDDVVAIEGVAGLNRAWLAPELLPTTAELAEPRLWIARTRAAA